MRSRPDFRSAAKRRLMEERGVSLAVSGLLSADAPAPAAVQVVSIDRLDLHPAMDAAGVDLPAVEELLASVVELGVLAPILVRVSPRGDRFEILDGARRWRAARAAGHAVIPVIVHALDDDAARRLVALGRVRRPIPYARLVAPDPARGPARVPVVISGPAEDAIAR